ncbi:MAG: DUF4013 domain-containing protein [Verrucomicrobiales bacterium]|nr:DUF4013 domain-containing protein [Verrucomicrobiales bacterium]
MSIQFKAALTDIFKTEKKWMTVLGLSVSILIPVVGPMVSFGYLLRRFTREREGRAIEDFDFNHFSEYLKIGLWPTLAMLAMSALIIPIVVLFSIAPAVMIPLAESGNETAMVIIGIVGFLLYLASLAAFTVLSYPVMLRSGLTMDFKSGFSWTFMKSFAAKVGLSLIGYFILLTIVSIPFVLLGYLALFIGVYVVAAWMQMALIHLVYQHYDLMVERGGERIEVNPEVTKNFGKPPLPTTPAEEITPS